MTLIAAGLAAAAPGLAQAQRTYPVKPVRIVVPSSAGGTQDTLARLLAPRLGESWGQAIVVENRGGAGGPPALLRNDVALSYNCTSQSFPSL